MIIPLFDLVKVKNIYSDFVLLPGIEQLMNGYCHKYPVAFT